MHDPDEISSQGRVRQGKFDMDHGRKLRNATLTPLLGATLILPSDSAQMRAFCTGAASESSYCANVEYCRFRSRIQRLYEGEVVNALHVMMGSLIGPTLPGGLAPSSVTKDESH